MDNTITVPTSSEHCACVLSYTNIKGRIKRSKKRPFEPKRVSLNFSCYCTSDSTYYINTNDYSSIPVPFLIKLNNDYDDIIIIIHANSSIHST